MWGSLTVGVLAVGSGALDGVLLAVIVLLPLAAFEVVAGCRWPPSTCRVRRSAMRIFAVLDTPPPVEDPAAPAPLPAAPRTPSRSRTCEPVDADRPYALNGISLDLVPGRRCAIVGPSGSGKTTLTSVLLRFLEPASGKVSLNGIGLDALAGDDVRKVIGLCAQDAHLFDSTIGANIRLARPTATDDEVRDALRRARILDWVDSRRMGSTPTSVSTAPRSPAVSASASRWRAPSSPISRSCCWTSPPSTSTSRPPTSSPPTC